MKWTCPVVCVWASLWLWAGGCQTTGSDPGAEVSLRYAPAQVTPPAGLDAKRITMLQDQALDRAQQPLAQVVAQIPKPKALGSSQATDPIAASVATAPPVPAVQRAYVAGRSAWKAGDHFEAIRQLQAALRLAPGNVTVLRLLGRIFTQAGNQVRASFYLQQALALDPGDVPTLYQLGRFALDQREFDQAIAYFAQAQQAYADQDADARLDPAMGILIHHGLGSSLLGAGYASAGIAAFETYLAVSREKVFDSAWGREVARLDRQQGAVRIALGDLHHQLGQPRKALAQYDRASELGFAGQLGLIRRQTYSHLRLGQPDQAQAIVHGQLIGTRDPALTLPLVSYLVEQGLDASRMIDALESVYRQDTDGAAALALALSELMDASRGQALLIEHLQQHPDDHAVFDAILRRATAHRPLHDEQVRALLGITAQAMAQSPTHARAYAGRLLGRLGATASAIRLTDTVDQGEPYPNMLLIIRGIALASDTHLDQAAQALEQAMALDPQDDLARLESVKLALLAHDFERARRLLEPLTDRDDPKIIQWRVRVLSQTGQKAQAMALLDRMLASGQTAVRLYLEKARLQIQLQDLPGAEQTLLDALNRAPKEEALYLALFELYDAMPDAVKPYQRLMRRMLGTIPQSRVARLKRAEWLEARSEFGQAQALLTQLLDENPNDVQAIAGLLQVYARSNQRPKAQALLDDRLAQNPANVALLRVASAFYEQIKDRPRLIEVTEKLLLLAPDNAQRAENLAQLYLDTQRPDQAQAILNRAMNHPQIQTTHHMVVLLWQALMDQDQNDQALALLDARVGQEPAENPTMLVQLRWRTLWEMGQADLAERTLKEAMERFPDSAADLGYDLSSLIILRGDRPRAHRWLAQLAQQYPEHAAINNDLAYAWAMQGRHLEQALTMAQQAVTTQPKHAAYLDTLGWVLYKLGRFDQAVASLRQAVGQIQAQVRKTGQPDHATQAVVNDHLGDALYRTGKPQQAVRTWARARSSAAALPEEDRADPTSDLFEIKKRLNAKIQAIRDNQPPQVADVPQAAPPDPAPAP